VLLKAGKAWVLTYHPSARNRMNKTIFIHQFYDKWFLTHLQQYINEYPTFGNCGFIYPLKGLGHLNNA
jgi:hypothetical protein